MMSAGAEPGVDGDPPGRGRLPIALTVGDPAGVGPELIVGLLGALRNEPDQTVVFVGSRAQLRLGLAHRGERLSPEQLLDAPNIRFVELGDPEPSTRPWAVGAVGADAGAAALAALERSLELSEAGEVAGLVFGPLNKTSLHLAGMTEPDEMRWFENRLVGATAASEVNVTTSFWTARVTSHVPLREVADLVTPDSVFRSIRLLHGLLAASGLDAPRIAVCALNPHAGENGLFGDEEITAIAPGVERSRANGIEVSGPFPCDTLFRRGFDGTFDGIVTMYHDQGQIALKTHAFDGGVTLEAGLGLPIATPAHGTAFDIVGQGIASPASTHNAYQLVRRLASTRG